MPLPGICRHEAMLSSEIWAASSTGAVIVAIGVDIVGGEKTIDAECRLYAGLFNKFEADDYLDFSPFCVWVLTIYRQPRRQPSHSLGSRF